MITATVKQLNNISQLLSVVSDELKIPILTFNQGTLKLASLYLTPRMLAVAQERIDELLATIPAPEIPGLLSIIGGSLAISDLTGAISPLLSLDGAVVVLSLTGYSEGVPTHTVISIPHSIAPFSAPSLL